MGTPGGRPLNWGTTPAQLFPEERALLHELAARTVDKFGPRSRVVNIGVRQGGSLWCLRSGAPSGQVVGIDIDLTTQEVIGDPEVILIEADSREFWSRFFGPVHLLFVDGSHEQGDVRRDIEGWTPKIPLGGFAAFHDYYETQLEDSFGVRLAVDEWKSSEGWERSWKHFSSVRLTVVYERIYRAA